MLYVFSTVIDDISVSRMDPLQGCCVPVDCNQVNEPDQKWKSFVYSYIYIYIQKPKYRPDVRGVILMKLVNELFTYAVTERNYNLVKKSTWYDGDVANEINKVTKELLCR